MRSKGIDGGRIEAVMNEISISINKNTVPGDKSALIPSGIRIGSPAMSTRGCKEQDFVQIMKFIDRATEIANAINKKAQGTKLKDFK
jgi:glycine hydroxymethyltransferase